MHIKVKILQEQDLSGEILPNLVKIALKLSTITEGHCRKGVRQWPIRNNVK